MDAFATRLAERRKQRACVDRAVARAVTLAKLSDESRPCGMTVAAPTTPGSASKMRSRGGKRLIRGPTTTTRDARDDDDDDDETMGGGGGGGGGGRAVLGKIDANSPVGVAGRITTVADAVVAERRRQKAETKKKTTTTTTTTLKSARGAKGGKSRLARSRSASDELAAAAAAASGTDGEDEDFVGVESFAEMLARAGLGARGALRETQRRALEEIYEESLEARSLRTVLENVKEAELEMAREESERRMAWVKSLEAEIEKKWANRVEETERENAQLRVEAHTRGLALDASKERTRELSRALEKAPEAARAPEKKMVTMETQTAPLPETRSVVEAPTNDKEEVESLKRELAAANARAQNEVRQHAGEFDALNDELAAKDAMIQRLRREVSEMKDRTSFYERCANTADERANSAEANSHALREEFLVLQSDVKKLNEQMHRNAKNAAEEKESIMAALAAAQARASEAETVPVAAKLNITDALISNETVCKCGSVATAQRLSAALADATARNSELQSKVTMLENKLEMREVSEDFNDDEVERLEKRALAAERRLSVAREAMTRYVSESQKCSPCPTVYNTVDELTPMKRAVEKWIEVSDAKLADEKESVAKNIEEEEEDVAEVDSDSDDEFGTPQRRRGMLPTPRLRARIAIRRTRGPPPKKPLAAYKPAPGEELCRRARAIGMSDSPFARKRD